MCRATYFLLFRRAGLEIAEVDVEEQRTPEGHDQLKFYDSQELRASRFRARLRRPLEMADSLAELREGLRNG